MFANGPGNHSYGRIGLSYTATGVAQVGRTVERPPAANIIVPQALRSSIRQAARLEITEITAGVVIVEQVATTTMDISLRNNSGSRTEAELVVPVPDGAVVRGFAFQAKGDPEPSRNVRRSL